MKKIVLYSLGGLIVLLVAGVLIVPGLIDWNAHKGRILSVIQEKTGRTAAIEGDIDLAILPAPALRVAGMRLANFDGAATPDMVRLKEVRLRLSIGALLEGRIAIEQLDLVEPVIALEVAADGRASWDFQPSGGTPAPEGGAAGAASAESAIDISLASVTIQNGSVTYRGADAAQPETVAGLNLAISAPSLQGPFAISGDARYRGLPVTVDMKAGPVSDGRPISVSLNLGLPDTGASAKFNGAVSDTGPDAQVTGELVLSGDNADSLAAIATGAGVSTILNQPVSVEAALSASRKSLALNDARIRLGDTLGNGAVSVSLGDAIGVDIAISVNRIDLDKLLADFAAGSDASKGRKTAASAASADGSASTANAAPSAAFSLPKNVNASLDLGVEAIQYNGGVIRQAGIRGSLANGAVTLDHASALLPGGSDVSLVGFLQPDKGQPKFEGDVAIASDSLRSLLQWIGVDIASLPADRLRGFSYTGKVTATRDSFQVPDFNIRLDASTIHGGLAVAMRDRPGFGLRLDVDQLNLDAYFPETAATTKTAPGAAVKPSPTGGAPVAATAAPLGFLEKFDANIDLRLDRVTYRKSIARKLVFDGQLVGGALTVRNLGVSDIAGASLGAKGTVQGFASAPEFTIDFDVAVAQPDRLFLFLDMPPPLPVAQLGKPSARGRVAGNLSAVTLDASLAGAGAALRLQGPLDMAAAAPTFDFKVALNHPELSDFLRLFMPEFRPAAAKLGVLKAGFGLKGTPAAVDLSSLDMTAGPVAVKGNVSLRLDGARPDITADLATSDVLLDLFQSVQQPAGSATARGRQQRAANVMPGAAGSGAAAADRWSQEPIDLAALQAVDATIRLVMGNLISGNLQFEKPQLDVVLKAGRLDLKQATAGLFGGTVSGQGNIDSAAGSPKVDMTLKAAGIDTTRAATAFGSEPRVAGPLSVNAAVTTTGASEAALVSALSGQGNLAGKLRVLATKKEQQAIGAVGIAAALFGNKVKELQQVGGLATVLVQAFGEAPADLSGSFTIQQGVLRTQDTVLSGAGARANTVATANLPAWTIESATSILRSGDDPATPYVSISLSGPMDSPNVRAGGAFMNRSSSGATEPSNPLGTILQGVTGGNGQSQEKVKPQDVLKGLLKGLGN